MPEACFLCLDTTEFMRNGDYFPNRVMAVQEASNILLSAKMQQNQENTVGYLTFGGNACVVAETLTSDVDRVLASMTKLPVGGLVAHFGHALLIAALALNHRANPRAEKRVVAFVGSPLTEDAATLEKLAKKLRKDDVAVDIVSIGVDANKTILEQFVQNVGKAGNSRLLVVPTGASVVNALYTSAILLGNDAVPTGADGSAAGAGGAGPGFEFGIDPNMDPELAMAIRMSLEEERHRQEQQASAAVAPTAAQPAAPAPPAATAAADHEMTEEEEMALALKMSMEPFDAAAPVAPPAPAAAAAPAQAANSTAAFDDAVADDDFLKELQDAINQNTGAGGKGGEKK